MLKLKPEVVEELIQFLKNDNCARFKEKIEEIGKSYRAIDMFFTTSSRFTQTISIPNNIINNANNCIGGKIRILVEAEIGVAYYSTSDGITLLNDLSHDDETNILDYAIIVYANSLIAIVNLLKEIEKKEFLGWLPTEITLDSDDPYSDQVLEEILKGQARGYYIKLISERDKPKVKINKVFVYYLATITTPDVDIRITSDLIDTEYDKKEWRKIIQEIKEALKPFQVEHDIRLILYP